MRKELIISLFALSTIVGVSGCRTGAITSPLDAQGKNDTQVDDRITQDELLAYCPKVSLREGTAYYATYQKGAKGDKSKLSHQASIGDVTRSCKYENGVLTMNVAIAGKVIPGPKARGSSITMPIRIAALQNGKVVYSKLHKHKVSVKRGAASQFVFNDPAVSFKAPESRNIQIFAGYDEGPYKTP